MALSLAFVSCTKDEEKVAILDSGLIEVPYKFAVLANSDALESSPVSMDFKDIDAYLLKEKKKRKKTELTELEMKILSDIQNTGKVNKDDIKQAFIEAFIADKDYDENDSKNQAVLDSFENYSLAASTHFTGWETPLDLKEQYDDYFAQKSDDLNYPYLIYNKNYPNIFDAFESHRFQCFSGTSLFLTTLMSMLDAKDIQSKKLVVIYQSGHVLPGYITQKDGHTYVQGVEMTVLGRGAKYIAETKNLKDHEARVIRYEDFILLNIFKNKVANIEEVAKNIISYNETLIGKQQNIPLNLIDDLYVVNADPLNFGTATAPEGDILPPRVDEVIPIPVFDTNNATLQAVWDTEPFLQEEVEYEEGFYAAEENESEIVFMRYEVDFKYEMEEITIGEKKHSFESQRTILKLYTRDQLVFEVLSTSQNERKNTVRVKQIDDNEHGATQVRNVEIDDFLFYEIQSEFEQIKKRNEFNSIMQKQFFNIPKEQFKGSEND